MIVQYTPFGAVLMTLFLACVMHFGLFYIFYTVISDFFDEENKP